VLIDTHSLHCQQQDGVPGTEILTADGANQRIRIYYASGTMETACTGFSAIERIVPADLNGDGLMDIVVADSTLGQEKHISNNHRMPSQTCNEGASTKLHWSIKCC
jgi:hypothetical protein